MANILLVDDDKELCEMLTEYLSGEGFTVSAVHDGDNAIHKIQEHDWDAVVLDVMMPGMNGFDVLKQVKPAVSVPILMLTARGEDTDTVLGLELGADDYVAKPVSPRVLVARLRALLRRGNAPTGEEIRVGDLQLDMGSREVSIDGKPIDLTGAEFNLLALLVQNAGHVVSRERLAEEGLGSPLQAYDRRIESHMAPIRRKLGPLADGSQRIRTIRGSGYQYVVH